MKALKRQAEDAEMLLMYMGNQFRELRDALLEEMEEIEQSFLQVRLPLI